MLNGVDAEWLEPDEVKELCPIVNISADVRYPVLGATYQPRAGSPNTTMSRGVTREAPTRLGVDTAPGLRGHRIRHRR